MKILGIDTSCDDTCASVLNVKCQNSNLKSCNFEILSNIISSQVKLHAKYGGVYPSLAKREHIKNLPLVFCRATKNIDISEINLIGVTVGPGLEPCLWQGVNFAIELAQKMKLLLVPVNHIEAHILANWLTPIYQCQMSNVKSQKFFPAVCLVVSGGHTQLIFMKKIGEYKLIGETRDDAAGECFDKTARVLGLGYPGGPAVAAEAAKLKTKNYKLKNKLPRPMIHTKDYDFSFSGLKTAVIYKVRSLKSEETKKKEFIREMCREVQQAIIDVLIHKTLRAAKNFRAKSIILGGGVTANAELKRQFEEKVKKEIPDSKFYIPDSKFCTDNAAMVATATYFHQKEATKNWPSNTTSTGFSKEKPNTAKRVEVDILGWKKIGVNANLKI